MPKRNLTVEVSEEVYQIFVDITSHTRQPVEEYAADLLTVEAYIVRDDPIERFIGAGSRDPNDHRTDDEVLADEAAGRRDEVAVPA